MDASITDQCIANLRDIGQSLERGEAFDPHMRCPASDLPYETYEVNGNVEVHDPDPLVHGYLEMYVSKKGGVTLLEIDE